MRPLFKIVLVIVGLLTYAVMGSFGGCVVGILATAAFPRPTGLGGPALVGALVGLVLGLIAGIRRAARTLKDEER